MLEVRILPGEPKLFNLNKLQSLGRAFGCEPDACCSIRLVFQWFTRSCHEIVTSFPSFGHGFDSRRPLQNLNELSHSCVFHDYSLFPNPRESWFDTAKLTVFRSRSRFTKSRAICVWSRSLTSLFENCCHRIGSNQAAASKVSSLSITSQTIRICIYSHQCLRWRMPRGLNVTASVADMKTESVFQRWCRVRFGINSEK
jgi:hypothetical protein